jgi:DNA polymerase-3 subunit epsilon
MINRMQTEYGDRMFAVAHFSRIEQVYLDRLWQENGMEKFPLPIICTHRIAKLLYPSLPSHGLRALAGWFGMPLDEGKRASNHVTATKQIWDALVLDLEKRGCHSLEQLTEFLEQKPVRSVGRREFLISREKRLSLPSSPGVYRYIDRSGRVLYVGKATSLKSRVNSYFTGGCRGDHRKLEMLAQAVDLEVTPTEAPLYAGLLEYDEIRRLKPPYNIAFKGKARNPVKSLALLVGTIASFDPSQHVQIIKDNFYDLDDWDTLRAGIALWRQEFQIAPDHFVTERELLNYGLPLLKQWIVDEKERRLLAKLETDEGAVEEEDEDIEVEGEAEFQWTAELVSQQCRRIIRRAIRHYIRAKWLRRLSEATIELKQVGDSSRKNQRKNPTLSIHPSEDMVELDLRRMRVLIHELRRAEAKGSSWQVTRPWPMSVPFWI